MTLPSGDQVHYDGTYYDFRAADGRAMIKVWVPPHASPVRGILISGHGGGSGDSRNFARDANMKAFAARFGFGLAGLHYFPGRQIYDGGRGELFFSALNAFASLGHHPELANVPFAVFGSSNGGSTAYGFANYAPERCICFVSNVSPGGNPQTPTDGAIEVPGVLIVGRYDPFSRELQGVERAIDLVSGARARGARWAAIIEEKGHEDGVAFDVYAKLVERAIALRYPQDADPSKGPVKLNVIPEAAGWLGTMPAAEPRDISISPFDSFGGDRASASWLLGEHVAYVYRAAATRHSVIGIGVEEVGRVYNPNTAPGTMYSVGGPLVEPGRTLRLVCDVRDLPGWRRITFYDGARRLGEVTAGNDPVLPVTVGDGHVVWCLNAVAVDADGNEHVTPPFYFAVTDPSLELRSDAEKTPPTYEDAIGPIGSKTMNDVPANYEPKAGGTAERILVAYGLTAEQEKTFAAEPGRVSAFWGEIDQTHDSIWMEQRTHARAGSTFSHVHTRDAQMRVKAAHSARGLYLYFEVTDNQFLPYDPDPTGYYNTDAVSALLDSVSSATINDPANAAQFMNQGWGLYVSTVQYQVAFGRDEPPPMFKLNRADPWDMNYVFVTVEDALKQKGIRIRWTKLDRAHRVQEWFIPWAQVGQPGDIASEPTVGTRLAFATGYTDRDRGGEDPGLPKQLTWIGNTSPWAFSATQGEPPRGWGDIEIGPAIRTAAPRPQP